MTLSIERWDGKDFPRGVYSSNLFETIAKLLTFYPKSLAYVVILMTTRLLCVKKGLPKGAQIKRGASTKWTAISSKRWWWNNTGICSPAKLKVADEITVLSAGARCKFQSYLHLPPLSRFHSAFFFRVKYAEFTASCVYLFCCFFFKTRRLSFAMHLHS